MNTQLKVLLEKLDRRRNPTNYTELLKFCKGINLETLSLNLLLCLEQESSNYKKEVEQNRVPWISQRKQRVLTEIEEIRAEICRARRIQVEKEIREILEKENVKGFVELFNSLLKDGQIEAESLDKNNLRKIIRSAEPPRIKIQQLFNELRKGIPEYVPENRIRDIEDYLSAIAQKIHRNASEYVVKGLFTRGAMGIVEDVIVSVYRGEQEGPELRAKKAADDIRAAVADARNAVFSYLDLNPGEYGIWVDIGDYPGSMEETGVYEKESIGCAVVAAILASVRRQAVARKVGITGQIEPTNMKVLEVGGVQAKAEAICWYDIEAILVPERNKADAQKGVSKALSEGAPNMPDVIAIGSVIDIEHHLLFSEEYYVEEHAEAMLNEARNLRRERNYVLAETKFNKLIAYAEEHCDLYPLLLIYIPEALYRIGNIHLHFGKIDEAKFYYEKAEDEYNGRAKPHIEIEQLANFHNSYSVYHLDVYDFTRALDMADKSLEGKKKVYRGKDKLEWIGSYNQKGQVLTFDCQFEEAEAVLLESLRIIEANLKAGERYASQTMNYLGMLYIKWASFENALYKFGEALRYLKQSKQLARQQGDLISELYACLGLAKLYLYWGLNTSNGKKYEQAIYYTDEGISAYDNYERLIHPIEGREIYPKGVLLKFKGYALWELRCYDDAVKSLRESYSFLETLESKNINIIAVTSRLELAKLRIRRRCSNDVKEAMKEIAKSIEMIRAFDIDSATEYFASALVDLQSAVQMLAGEDNEKTLKFIQQVLNRIPY